MPRTVRTTSIPIAMAATILLSPTVLHAQTESGRKVPTVERFRVSFVFGSALSSFRTDVAEELVAQGFDDPIYCYFGCSGTIGFPKQSGVDAKGLIEVQWRPTSHAGLAFSYSGIYLGGATGYKGDLSGFGEWINITSRTTMYAPGAVLTYRPAQLNAGPAFFRTRVWNASGGGGTRETTIGGMGGFGVSVPVVWRLQGEFRAQYRLIPAYTMNSDQSFQSTRMNLSHGFVGFGIGLGL